MRIKLEVESGVKRVVLVPESVQDQTILYGLSNEKSGARREQAYTATVHVEFSGNSMYANNVKQMVITL